MRRHSVPAVITFIAYIAFVIGYWLSPQLGAEMAGMTLTFAGFVILIMGLVNAGILYNIKD